MKARFFCEHCTREVPADARSCPYCGKMFSAVRCPSCGFEATPREMLAGCPVCGFLAGQAVKGPKGKSGPAPRREAARGPRVPPVFYRVAMVVLAAGVIALLLVLFLSG